MRNLRDMSRMVAPIKNAMVNMIARAVIAAINDGTGIQSAQVKILEGESRDEVERFQQYGFTSVPLPGAEGVVIFVGGNRDHALLVNVDDRRYRPKNLAAGEVQIYNHVGDYVHIKADGTMKVVASTKVEVTCPLVEMSGDLRVKGYIIDDYENNSNTMGDMRQIYNQHDHNETNSVTNEPNQSM